jgi:hypothetical protein
MISDNVIRNATIKIDYKIIIIKIRFYNDWIISRLGFVIPTHPFVIPPHPFVIPPHPFCHPAFKTGSTQN